MNRTSEAAAAGSSPAVVLPWILRIGIAMCFIGHGAFGLITKQAWVPYFGVVGLAESWAWKLMPWVGAMDVAMGFLTFIWPCRALFAWGAFWCVWTALLRPFAGEGWPEFFERAGNYGVPLAILLAVGCRSPWFARLPDSWPELSGDTIKRLVRFLQVMLATLLIGHALCALVLEKASLANHYNVFGVADTMATMRAVGWFELVLAAAVLTVRHPALMLFVYLWKLGTESLFLTSGALAPGFEVIERGGSYIVPLALAFLLSRPLVAHGEPQVRPA